MLVRRMLTLVSLSALIAASCGRLNQKNDHILRAPSANPTAQSISGVQVTARDLFMQSATWCKSMEDMVREYHGEFLKETRLGMNGCSQDDSEATLNFSITYRDDSLEFVFVVSHVKDKVPGYKNPLKGMKSSLKLRGSDQEFSPREAPFLLVKNLSHIGITLKKYFTYRPGKCAEKGRGIDEAGMCHLGHSFQLKVRTKGGRWNGEKKDKELKTFPEKFLWEYDWKEETEVPEEIKEKFIGPFVELLNAGADGNYEIKGSGIKLVYGSVDRKNVKVPKERFDLSNAEQLARLFGNETEKSFDYKDTYILIQPELKYKSADSSRKITLQLVLRWLKTNEEKIVVGFSSGVVKNDKLNQSVKEVNYEDIVVTTKSMPSFRSVQNNQNTDLFHRDLPLIETHFQNWIYSVIFPQSPADDDSSEGSGPERFKGLKEFLTAKNTDGEKPPTIEVLDNAKGALRYLQEGDARIETSTGTGNVQIRRLWFAVPDKIEPEKDDSEAQVGKRRIKGFIETHKEAQQWCKKHDRELISKSELETFLNQKQFEKFPEIKFGLFGDTSKDETEDRFFYRGDLSTKKVRHVMCIDPVKQ